MSVTALVPARSGSTRLPHKNVRLLAGKPLLVWTLEACVRAEGVDEVLLSTDSEEYWETARRHVRSEKLSLDLRDAEEAGASVRIFDYLKTKRHKVFSGRQGAFVLALPTVPLRGTEHVDEALALFRTGGRPVFSATTYGFPISFAFHLNGEGGWSPVFADSPMVTGNTRSQDQKTRYRPNGALYVRDLDDLGSPSLRTLYQDAAPFLMDRDSSIDIDDKVDFLHAEAILRQRQQSG